jgi:hypothetical protein
VDARVSRPADGFEITVYFDGVDDMSDTDETFLLPSKFEVCDRCEGKGRHTNPNIDGNGITSSEMDELGPEFLEDYLSGVYDVACQVCGGERVVPAIDYGRLDVEMAHAAALWEEQEEARARMDAADRRTMLMESGGGAW